MASAKEKPFWIDVHEVCANVITARPVGAGRAKKVTEVALISLLPGLAARLKNQRVKRKMAVCLFHSCQYHQSLHVPDTSLSPSTSPAPSKYLISCSVCL